MAIEKTFDEVAGELRAEDVKPFLQRAKNGGYICPHCKSGEGVNGTGAVKYYPDTGTASCHACKKKVDAADMWGLPVPDAVHQYAAQKGYTIIPGRSRAAGQPDRAGKAPSESAAEAPKPERVQAAKAISLQAAPAADYTGYYRICSDNLRRSEAAQAYLRSRGISPETALKYDVGFDPEADPASKPGAAAGEWKPHPAPRLIFPAGEAHYEARCISPDAPKGFCKIGCKGNNKGLFNRGALWESEAGIVFIVEGAFDALSLLEIGVDAVALNGTGGANKLLEELQAQPTTATLLLALDADEAGQRAQKELQDGLNHLNIVNAAVKICGKYKDPNEYLAADRMAFDAAVQDAIAAHGNRTDNTADYIDTIMAHEIEAGKKAAARKTGFANLDREAGALYTGLYILAAISSLGKTTFALQMADQLAAAGQDVIYFSMEQSRLELVTKSIARYMRMRDKNTAVSAINIRHGYLEAPVLAAAAEYKAAVGRRMQIVEGNFNCNVAYIRQYVRNYIARNKTTPVIIVDYLQILRPASERSTAKETMDAAVVELQQLAREVNTAVIAISSLNRANYLAEFSAESLKESGGIEYTASVIWGLQLACLDEPLFASSADRDIQEKRKRVNAAKADTPRKVKLVCVKNRNGTGYYSCYFDYYPVHDYYVPSDGNQQPQPKQPGQPEQKRL